MTTLFGDSGITDAAPIHARPERKKYGWLPLLTLLFCISYGLMTMLIVEQGSTIESQRVLIHELYRDSAELTASKLKAQQEKNALLLHAQPPAAKTPTPSTQAPSIQAPSTQVPSVQAPSTQAPATQTPSSQAVPRRGRASSQKIAPRNQGPSRAVELVDARRALITI